MNTKPLVSVVVPTYKHRGYVCQTLDSVFAQIYTDYEVIVINDGSPDDTAEVLQPPISSGRIRYIEQANAGQAAARNRGIAEARGEFVALLDDDDLWPPDKLGWQVAALQARPDAVLAYGYSESFGDVVGTRHPGPEAPSGSVRVKFIGANWLESPGQALIRTEALKSIGGFDTTIWGADDWDLYIRLAEQGEFVYRDRLALYYRRHAHNASKDIWKHYTNVRRVAEKHRSKAQRTESPFWLGCGRPFADYYAQQCLNAAREHQTAQDWDAMRRMLITALRIQPLFVRRRSLVFGMAASFLGHRTARPE